MQRVTPRPSIPSSGRGRPARCLAGLGAIAGPRALPPGATRPARRCGPWWRKPASSEAANVGPEAVLLSAMAGLGENPLAFAVESSRTAAPVTRQRVKSDRTPSDWYRYAGMAELADATDLKSVDRKVVRVRIPLPAL